MRFVAACLLSAVTACVCTAWLLDGPGPVPAAAQAPRNQPRIETGPRFPGAAAADKAAPPAEVAGLFDAAGLSPEEAINIAVYERANRAVVNITTRGARVDGFFLMEVPTEGSGSGSVIDNDGHILTNYHVVEDARSVGVTLFNGKTYDATVVGADPVNDIAVIHIDAPREELFPVRFADSGRLKVGMKVYAIGNPFGLERTMTTGIISSVNRSLQIRGNRTIKSIIQTDAAVNPGNSGGPLLDAHGRQIGINTAIASSTGQSAGVGFAIPVNLVTRFVPDLIKYGRVIRPETGIERVYEAGEGLLVARLTRGGPAETAGIRGPRVIRTRRGPFVVERIDRTAADLIVAVDGRDVKTADDFLSYIESRKVGETVEITVLRDGKRVVVPLTLGGGEAEGNGRDTRP